MGLGVKFEAVGFPGIGGGWLDVSLYRDPAYKGGSGDTHATTKQSFSGSKNWSFMAWRMLLAW